MVIPRDTEVPNARVRDLYVRSILDRPPIDEAPELVEVCDRRTWCYGRAIGNERIHSSFRIATARWPLWARH